MEVEAHETRGHIRPMHLDGLTLRNDLPSHQDDLAAADDHRAPGISRNGVSTVPPYQRQRPRHAR